MRVYAYPDELVPDWISPHPEWMDTDPHRATGMIQHASLMVEHATILARYDVDDEGYPTDQEVIDAFKNATCFQVAAWAAAGLDPRKGIHGQPLRITSQSAGGGSVSYEGVATNEDIDKLLTTLCAPAMMVLRQAGLLGREVVYRR